MAPPGRQDGKRPPPTQGKDKKGSEHGPKATSNPILEDLRQKIRARQVLVIVGAGVSIASTRRAPVASWVGLLQHGVQRVVDLRKAPTPKWADSRLDDIQSGDTETMIVAAEAIQTKLGGAEGGEYRTWLRESVGSLKVEDKTLIEAITRLGCPIATTNYDSLLSEVTGQPAVTWEESSDFERVIKGDDPGILHLHGHWRRPTSVILGIRDYTKVLGNQHAQAVQQALRTTRTLLFIGCGAGTQDPNIGALLRWSGQVFPGSEYRHYRLERESEVAERQKEHPAEQRIQVLSYGEEHADLAGFLVRLVEDVEVEEVPPSPPPTRAVDPLTQLIQAQLREYRPLPTPGSKRPLDLAKNYVTLTLWNQGALGKPDEHFATRRKWEEGDYEALEKLGNCPRLDITEVLRQHTSVAILGDPGAGKTTLLKHLLWSTLQPEALARRTLPIFVNLRTWQTSGVDLRRHVVATLARISDLTPQVIAEMIDQARVDGRLLLLLDGFDEVAEGSRLALRQYIDTWITTLTDAHQTNRALITCRVMSWKGEAEQLQVKTILQVAPFTDPDIQHFTHQHFAALPGLTHLGQELLGRLRYSHPRVKELGRNPLLLTLLCFYYETRRDLPQRRVALYQEIVNTLLRKWRGEEGNQVDADMKEGVLEAVALKAMENPTRPLTFAELRGVVWALKVVDKTGQAIGPQRVIDEIVTGSSLLVDLEAGETYTFMHLTLQEYFVARALHQSGWKEVAEKHRGDNRWNEVWRLLGALLDEPGELLATLFAEKVDADLADAIAQDARTVTLSTLQRCARLGFDRPAGSDVPSSILGVLLRGRLEGRSLGQGDPQVMLEEGVGRASLLNFYLNVLRQDAELARSEGRRLDPMVVYAALSHMERWIEREEGAAELRAAVANWRGPDLPPETWVLVPGGILNMGNTKDTDADAYSDEAPIHPVQLSAYHLGKCPVTNLDYATYHPSHLEWLKETHPYFPGATRPVVYISWWDAWLYTRWCGGKLPTEAQWEWAARGPEGRKYPWGEDAPTPKSANYREGGPGRSTPVGSYPQGASWVGALDMAGNVFEWCQDWYGLYPPGEQVDPTGPVGPLSTRVVRGGSWYVDASWLRGSYRGGWNPTGRLNYMGFRVVVPSSPGHAP